MSIRDLHCASARRRTMLTKPKQAEPQPTSLLVDFHAGMRLEDASGIAFLKNSGGSAAASEISIHDSSLLTTIGLEHCITPEAGSYIAILHPRYEAEAIEIECYMPNKNNGVILTCGNGRDNLAAMQPFFQMPGNPERYFKLFDTPTTTRYRYADYQYVTQYFRVAMRLERRGQQTSVYMNHGESHQAPVYLMNTSVVGSLPTAFDSTLQTIGFQTGFVFPKGDVYVARLRWWAL